MPPGPGAKLEPQALPALGTTQFCGVLLFLQVLQ